MYLKLHKDVAFFASKVSLWIKKGCYLEGDFLQLAKLFWGYSVFWHCLKAWKILLQLFSEVLF